MRQQTSKLRQARVGSIAAAQSPSPRPRRLTTSSEYQQVALDLQCALSLQVMPQVVVQLRNFFRLQLGDRYLQHGAHCGVVLSDQRGVIRVRPQAHEELAVEAVCQTTMPRNGVAKVLNLERALEA